MQSPDDPAPPPREAIKGRGSAENPPNRFERLHYLEEPEAGEDEEEPARPRTLYLRDPSRTILATNESPDVGFDASVNPYRGCEHGCVYCLAPETPVLHGDLVWRPLGEASEGDVLVGFDEHPTPGRTRRLRPAVVEGVWWSRKPTWRLVTARAELVATAEHRWLRARSRRWTRTEELVPGQQLRWIIDAKRAHDDCEDATGPSPVHGAFRGDPDPVVAIERTGIRDVVDIQTSTGTFFAAGLATHNCYARPTHEYLGFSAGLDFETRILVKEDAPELLRRTLASPRFEPRVIALSGVTDPYQPVEQRLGLTRRCLEVLAEFRNPTAIVTKSRLVARDADVLGELARHEAVSVHVSVTSLDPELHRRMEPRASSPRLRLEAIEALARAGIPVGAMVGPVIPGLTDHEIPGILAAAAGAGASFASWILLRLPFGVAPLFEAWLERHYPERKGKVLHRIQEVRSGRLNDPRFGSRMRGEGLYAEQIESLFALAARRAGLARRGPTLSTRAFRRPAGAQLALFGSDSSTAS